MAQEQTQGNQQQNDGNNKVEAAFASNIAKLTALFGGQQDIMKTNKMPNDVVGTAIEALIAEKQATKVEEFKKKAANLLERKVEFDRFEVQKKKEFEEAVVNKKKEFNKEMEECFKLVESIEDLRKSYIASLGNIGTNGPQAGSGGEVKA